MEQSTGYTLDGLCISPIQRIPRYQMLLEVNVIRIFAHQISKCSRILGNHILIIKISKQPSKALKPLLPTVHSQITFLISQIVNEKRRDYEEKEKVFQIFNSLVGKAKEVTNPPYAHLIQIRKYP